MKKTVFVLLLVALLLSLALPVAAMAGFGADDPCTPGNGHCFVTAPPGLQNNDHGKAGDNWIVP